MWIVRIALSRPYTFVVMALLLLIIGPLVISRTPKDIFPNIDIPVITAIWQYNGLNPEEMTNRIVSNYERTLTTVVNDIEHIESQTLNGISIVKVFFHPGAQVDLAMAQITSASQSAVRSAPPGAAPPFIIVYNASTVPILQLSMSGKNMSEQQLSDIGQNFLRTQLATIQGASLPNPYGGRQRQIQVDLDLQAMQEKGLDATAIVNALGDQNLVLPAGTAKIGNFEYDVDLNSSPRTVEELNDLPIKTIGNSTIYLRDVGHVRDGFPPQRNIVRVDGQRSSLLTVVKTGSASTLDIIEGVKRELARGASALPAGLEIRPLADQSVFVRAAIQGVLREAIIAACLTSIMILIFLGSWRSTLIIGISIPLSILTSIIVLSALGQTINIMTLGGLALAVGILVDDATVEIENIDRNLAEGKETVVAILDGARQIAVPAFVSTLSICIVFVPMFFLTGVARYLFVPLAEAVVFAMIASYLLSRTLVPTMAKYLLKGHAAHGHAPKRSLNPFVLVQNAFEKVFERLRNAYRSALESCIEHRNIFAFCFIIACFASFALLPWVGEDFFPAVDSGQLKLHLRAPTGTRIEETAALCDRVDEVIRRAIPGRELGSVIDNIGLPNSGLNLSYSISAPIGSEDADILVSLNENHRPTEEYVHDLREKLNDAFPGVMFYFLPADIVSQILNFGLPAPIDIQVVGANVNANREFAAQLLAKVRQVPGTTDLRIQQPFNHPKFHVIVDRTKAGRGGFTERDVASSLLVSLSGSGQTVPTYWLDPRNGVQYSMASQTPQYQLDSLESLNKIPVLAAKGQGPAVILGDLASISRDAGMGVVSHYNVQPVIDIYGSVQRRDLGSVSQELMPIVDASRKDLPRGSQLVVRGQIETMKSSFAGLLGGLLLAIVLDYFLIVVNFQSWLDPFIIIAALPAALAGIVWMLFMTHTTLSVPALTGSIMCMGVATANSILVVSFAKDRMAAGTSGVAAALEAGFTRFRPVIMTALAMIIGMVPMALGLGEGGEQNAPLGRAVIGGLMFATVATLFFVPAIFSLFHKRSTAVLAPEQESNLE
ncbi:MAG TPA: efflux RND transporter permease subunit [Terriglobia bacterium]|jgi:multidrug efflux pump subunit AcrB